MKSTALCALLPLDEHLPVNIVNPGEFTMIECANMVLEVTGSVSKLVFEPLPEDDPIPMTVWP